MTFKSTQKNSEAAETMPLHISQQNFRWKISIFLRILLHIGTFQQFYDLSANFLKLKNQLQLIFLVNVLVKAVKIILSESSELTFDKILFIKPVSGKSAYFPQLETTGRRVAGRRQDSRILESLGQVLSNTLLIG